MTFNYMNLKSILVFTSLSSDTNT